MEDPPSRTLESASYPPELRSAQANLNIPEPLQSVPPQSAQERTGGSPAVGVKAVRSSVLGRQGRLPGSVSVRTGRGKRAEAAFFRRIQRGGDTQAQAFP